MKPEYDCEKGVRGKFFRPGATLQIPVYLEPEVLSVFSERAEKSGVEVDRIVNDLLKRDVGIVETAG